MISKKYSIVAPYQCHTKGSDVWQLYQNGRDIQLTSRVNTISICSQGSTKFCIPCGHKVYLYKCNGDKLYRKLSGYASRVSCCQFRTDGKLVIVGEENGVVRICTTDKNSFHLRTLKAHKACVNAVSYLSDGYHVASAGADAYVRVWDVSLGTQTAQFLMSAGKEPVNAMTVSLCDPNLLYAGNMGGVVALYDIRQPKPAQIFNLPNAISAFALDGAEKTLVIADGSFLRLWNPTSKNFLPTSDGAVSSEQPSGVRIHYKIVTDLCVVKHPDPQQGEVLLSVSMDKLLKVTSLVDLKELHQRRHAVPLTAVGATVDCSSMIVGGEKGFLKIRHLNRKAYSSASKMQSADNGESTNQDEAPVDGIEPGLQQLMRDFSGQWRGGDNFVHMTTDTWLSQPFDGPRRGPKDWLAEDESAGNAARKVPLIFETSEISRAGFHFYSETGERQPFTKVDRLLTRFSHSRALSVVTRYPWAVTRHRPLLFSGKLKQRLLAIGVIRELIRRGTLVAAVAGRDVLELTRLFKFIRHNIWRRESATVCLELYNCILDQYSADELSQLSEFSKVNVVLQHLTRNSQSVNELCRFLRTLATEQTALSEVNEKSTSIRAVGKRNAPSSPEPADTTNPEMSSLSSIRSSKRLRSS